MIGELPGDGNGRGGTQPRRSALARRWAVLMLYVAALYTILPFGPRIGLALAGTRPGAWLLGPGLVLIAGAGALLLLRHLRRRAAPGWAYVAALLAAVSYAAAFSWLRALRLERTHLPEYGVAAVLAWRAVAPMVSGTLRGYVAGAALGGAIGYADELLQAAIPGRHYDLRDVAMNAIGAVLGMVVLAAARSGGRTAPAEPHQVVRLPLER